MHRTLKEKFRLERGFPTFEQAQEAVARTLLIYNNKYPHGSLGYLTILWRHLTRFIMEESLARRSGGNIKDAMIVQKLRK